MNDNPITDDGKETHLASSSTATSPFRRSYNGYLKSGREETALQSLTTGRRRVVSLKKSVIYALNFQRRQIICAAWEFGGEDDVG